MKVLALPAGYEDVLSLDALLLEHQQRVHYQFVHHPAANHPNLQFLQLHWPQPDSLGLFLLFLVLPLFSLFLFLRLVDDRVQLANGVEQGRNQVVYLNDGGDLQTVRLIVFVVVKFSHVRVVVT